ncbi:MAG: hypothetical protein V7L26_14225 [Nostoc sp.]|uniref:hypothetical protein n=1 Tax=Nostoc sp. TaxID=1180 RepID=UPI002FEFB31A
MFKIFTNDGKLVIDCEFYDFEDASEYAQAELGLQIGNFIVRKVGFGEQQPFTKEDL